ncbi:peptide-methionine (S)-S-oxide reductase MsrA [Paenibacillus bovis]|nr:peptide-methionine (S)-S-oxide reductase [Paenibacillus bovis]
MSVHENGEHGMEKEKRTPVPQTEILTLGMGCFWGPEALFGHLPGVLYTRTGYAGGTTGSPVYRQLGDHSETIEIEFAPSVITLEQLLEMFWNHHNPSVINGYKGRQYHSLLFYRNEQQRCTIEQMQQTAASAVRSKSSKNPASSESAGTGNSGAIDPDGIEKRRMTEIQPYDTWYPAEARHQKYYLQRQHRLMEQLYELYPDQAELFHSTLAARLNGFSRGHITLAQIRQDIPQWPLSEHHKYRINQWLADQQDEQ